MKSIPKGYKKTEVGIIPEEWDVVTFKLAVAKVEAGTSVNSWNQTAYCGSVGILKTSCISSGFFEKIENKRVIDQDISRVTCPLVEGRIIVSRMNTPMLVGMLAIVPKDNYSGLYLPDRLWSLSVNANYFDAHFVHHWGHTQQYRQDVTTASDGTSDSMKNISKSKFLSLYIPQPPLPEQKAIAEVLSDMDALIQAQKELIAKKRGIKQGAMQGLLSGRVRLPGYETKGWKHTDIGDIPDNWVVKTIEECMDNLDNLRKPLNESDRKKMQGYIPYCGANGVLDFVNDYVINRPIILMAEDGGYFDEYETRPIAYRMQGPLWVNNHAHILVAKEHCYQDYLFYCLVHKNIMSFLSNGTRAKLNKSEMNKIKMIVPIERQEQQAIAQVLSDMDGEIETLEAELEKLHHMKRGMMQELLTGRIRLI